MSTTKKRGRPAKTKISTTSQVSQVPTTFQGVLKESLFVFSLDMGGQILEGEGVTALEALRAIPVPTKIMSKGVLTITQGDKKKVMLFMPPRLKRLFYHQAQPIIIKWLVSGMKVAVK